MKVLTIIAMAIIITMAATPAPAADVEIIQVSGLGAEVSFYTIDDSGIRTDVSVILNAGRTHNPPGKPTTLQTLGIFISRVNSLTGETLFEGTGFSTDVHLQVSENLSSATSHATVSIFNFADNSALDVELNLTWTAPEESELLSRNEHVEQRGLVVNQHFKGTLRQGTASGSIGVGTDDILITGPNVTASLWDTASSRITVEKSQGSASSVASSTCSGGHWGGFWTFDSARRQWVWTWVFYSCSGNWMAS